MAKKDILIFGKQVSQNNKKIPFECVRKGGLLIWSLDGVAIYKCSIIRLIRSKTRLVVNDIISTRLLDSGVDTLEVEKIIKGEIDNAK